MAKLKNPKMLEQLNEAIKICRNRRKMSQEVLADLSEVSRTRVQSVDRGDANLTVDVLLSLKDGLNINIFELLILAWEKEYKAFLELELARRALARQTEECGEARAAQQGRQCFVCSTQTKLDRGGTTFIMERKLIAEILSYQQQGNKRSFLFSQSRW